MHHSAPYIYNPSYLGTLILNNMEWFTLEWLMKNLEWAVGLLVVGCLILFLFPIFLGYDLKKKADNQDVK